MPLPFRAVIFDLDGLMLDTESIARLTMQKAARELGYDLTDELFLRLVGRTGADGSAIMREQWGADFPCGSLWERTTRHWDHHVAINGIPLKTGLIELLDFLEGRPIRKAVATSSKRDSAHAKLGVLAQRFDVLVTGDEVRHGKPAPDIFLLAAERLGVAAGDCIVLEDSRPGLQAARAAGMTAIMVPDLIPADEEVAHVCHSLHEVQAWLKDRLESV